MANKKSNFKYVSKEECLKILFLKFHESEDGALYLMSLDELFKQKIYSKSSTDIKKGIKKLEKRGFILNKNKKEYDKALYYLNSRKCNYCGNGFKPKNNADKYCSDYCRNTAKKEQDEINKRKQRANSNYFEKKLGTSNLGPHPKNDFDNEQKAIKNECNRLKIYKN